MNARWKRSSVAGREPGALMQPTPSSANDVPVRSIDELEQVFHDAEKPRERHLIGAEAEKFGVDAHTLEPIPYAGKRSILAIFDRLEQKHGWSKISEAPGSPVIALERGATSITLEPGAQLELSGAPWPDVHEIRREFITHYGELAGVSSELGLTWWSIGYHPMAKPSELPWVPKQRYAIMREYLPTRGRRGRDMMQRTSTVQANFDYSSEEDAMRKLAVVLRLAPVFQAMTANAPFAEGRVSQLKSERLDVWLNMDPSRSGLIAQLWNGKRLSYRDYVEWALDAGMFFIKRGERLVLNTGQTFRDFLANGFEGVTATQGDWVRHLATLFPDARLKSTLEVRTCDSLPEGLTMAVPALFTGLLYDDAALADAEEMARGVELDDALVSRAEVPRLGLQGRLGDRPLRSIAERLLEIAGGGLARRARRNERGEDESVYLRPLAALVGAGQTPADLLLGRRVPGSSIDAGSLASVEVARTPRNSAR
jgi:glutamate--cysteine ligase